MNFISTIIIALVLAAPASSASHWALYGAGVEESIGATREPDGVVVHEPGHPLDGVANRVTSSGHVVGDGGLFLDARLVNRVGSGQSGAGASTAFATDALVGRGDILVPGSHESTAWFGWWSDHDADGVIDDVADAVGSGADEFVWRGLGSDEVLTIVQYDVPGQPTDFVSQSFGVSFSKNTVMRTDRSRVDAKDARFLVDHTSREDADPGWYGAFVTHLDAGLLATVDTVTIAGARTLVGSRLVVDMDDPGALVDVDRYAAVSPEVDALYWSTVESRVIPMQLALGLAAPVLADGLALGAQAYAETLATANQVLAEVPSSDAIVDAGLGAFQTGLGLALCAAFCGLQLAYSLTYPGDPKEPTTDLDDYEGRATFGGVGDRAGSYNAYTEYGDAHHFYFDAYPRTAACLGGNVAVPGTGTGTPLAPTCSFLPVDPWSASKGGHVAWTTLGFVGRAFMWRDVNHDTFLGSVCNVTDPEAFDAERNTCHDDELPTAWPHNPGTSGETIPACLLTNARGGTFKVEPLDGPWPSVIVMRDAKSTTSVLTDASRVELHDDSEPIILRWDDACQDASTIRSRDILAFPAGSSVAIAFDARVGISGYRDLGLGVDVGPESVRDHDVVPASL